MAAVLIVEDDEFMRSGLERYLAGRGFRVVAVADSESATRAFDAERFDAAIVDIELPQRPTETAVRQANEGIRLAQRLKARRPAMGVVLLSAYEDRGRDVFAMLREGVRGLGYLLKGSRPATVLEALHATMAGRIHIDAGVTSDGRLLVELRERLTAEEQEWVTYALSQMKTLSERELVVARRRAAAQTVEAIGQAMGLATKTVEKEIREVYQKLGLSTAKGRDGGGSELNPLILLSKVIQIHDLSDDSG